jgi:hypothetical protein
VSREDVLLFDDFESTPDGALPDGWWVEGGERVWVEKGRLRVKADPKDADAPACPEALRGGGVCTVWRDQVFGGDLRVEFDACVVDSSIDANNINFFLLYSDPSGRPLHESRAARASAAYDLYHGLNGYIFTFLNDTESPSRSNGMTVPTSRDQTAGQSLQARFRMRRCPGFRLVSEAFGYHCRKGVTYHVVVTRLGGRLTYAVDGHVFLDWTDDAPLPEGHIGLRTYRTDLWWDNVKVIRLG